MLLVLLDPLSSYSEDLRPAKIKAALVYYVLKFVDWPQMESQDALPLIMCKLGADNVSEQVREILATKEVKGRSVKVVEVSAEGAPLPEKCNVIYFSTSVSEEVRSRINMTFKNESTLLTICEGQKNYSENCMVQIFEEENKARLSIDKARRTAAKLNISSELLELAVIATPLATGR